MSEKKNLLYILIGSGTKPLASYSIFTGNFIKNCEDILPQIFPNTSAIINSGDYLILYLNENNISYLIMTISSYPKDTAKRCIYSIKNELESILKGRNFDNEIEYGLSEELNEKLKMKFEYYNENTDIVNEDISKFKSLEIIKDEVNEESNQINNREEKLKISEDKTNSILNKNSTYKQGAIKVKNKNRKKKICCILLIIIFILIIFYGVISYICGNFTFQCEGKLIFI